MDQGSPLEDQLGSWCKHFTGRLQEHCRAGIAYACFPPGRLPCLKEQGTTAPCAMSSFPTPAEIQAQKHAFEHLVMQVLPHLCQGICPQCGTPIERKEMEGLSQYAWPCRHRLKMTY